MSNFEGSREASGLGRMFENLRLERVSRIATLTLNCPDRRKSKQIGGALWGSGAAQFRDKNVIVVEGDVDISSYEQQDWVNAGSGGVVVFPGIFGSVLDPSTPLEERDVNQLGSGLWNRVVIDATRNRQFERRSE